MDIVSEGSIGARIEKLEWAALKHYNERFSNLYYELAVDDKSVAYASCLIDAAMAICGHPAYAYKYNARWGQAAWTFLGLFA